MQQNYMKELAQQLDHSANQWPYTCWFRGLKMSMYIFSLLLRLK